MATRHTHFFADVDLPFHVWVRERTAAGERWVLRDTSARHLLRDEARPRRCGGRAAGPARPTMN